MRQAFERIYRNNEWGRGSGEGSFPEHTTRYGAFLKRFLRERDIRSVLDLGCGDGTTAIPEATLGANVLGVDIAENLVAAGNARARDLGLTNVRFQVGDASQLSELAEANR